jgi:phosphoglycerate dehydrogenase-like enzyme
MKPKIVFADSFNVTEACRKKMEELGNIVELTLDAREKFITETEDADIIIAEYQEVDAGIIANAKKLKGVVVYGVGTNHIDLDAAAKAGVVVANTRGANAEAVAELTFSLLLNCVRRTCQANAYVKGKKWRSADSGQLPPEFTGTELAGKFLAIIGLGEIGRRVARIGKGFAMEIGFFDPFVSAEMAAKLSITPYANIDDLLAAADIVSVHAPLTSATRNLLNAERLKLLRKSAVLVVTSRGGIVDEEALAAMLANGDIAGAGLDVFAQEPVALNSRLLELENAVVTPHMAASTYESVVNVSEALVSITTAILKGGIPNTLVNGQLLAKYNKL